jgi:IclR family transcriptional regulator, acetate operon repressor
MHKAPSEVAGDAKQLTKSPGRVTQMLELIARAGAQGMTLTELSKAMDSPRTSLIGLIESLLHEDYIVRHEKSYRLGWSAFRLATAVTSSFQLPALARSEMERLARETGETTMLCTFANEKKEIVYVDKCESTQSLRFTIEIGTQRPLYSSAAGRAMLAFQPEEWQREYLRTTKLERLTPKTVVNARQIRDILARTREVGYSVTLEETAIGVCGVASPILDQFHRPIGALVIGAPLARGAGMADKLGEAVRQSALKMSRVLGYDL